MLRHVNLEITVILKCGYDLFFSHLYCTCGVEVNSKVIKYWKALKSTFKGGNNKTHHEYQCWGLVGLSVYLYYSASSIQAVDLFVLYFI